jgi:excisionase family DNA binding protein
MIQSPKKPVTAAMLSPQDAANYMRTARSTIYNLMERGVLPSVKIGTLRRIPLKAIESLMADAA